MKKSDLLALVSSGADRILEAADAADEDIDAILERSRRDTEASRRGDSVYSATIR